MDYVAIIIATFLITSLLFWAYTKYNPEIQNKKIQAQKEFEKYQKQKYDSIRKWEEQEKQKIDKKIQEYKSAEKQKFEELKEQYNSNYEQYVKEYDNKKQRLIDEMSKEVQKAVSNSKDHIEEIREQAKEQEKEIMDRLNDLKAKEKAAIESRIRQYKEQNKEDYYKIQISSEDLQDIEELESILPKLKNERALRKAIYTIYYLDPVKDLVNRLTGGRKTSGIYKITNISTGECYVGQSVDIERRIRDHTKRGSGASEATQNKLYPVMKEKGIHNFTYEIIEEVEQPKLNEREKYWQEYFGAKIFGYSKL